MYNYSKNNKSGFTLNHRDSGSGFTLNRKGSGFTIIEMIVVISLISIITLLVVSMLVTSLKTYRTKKQVVDAQEKVAAVMREFEQTTRAADELISVGQNELSFYRFYDLTSVSPTKVRYFIDGNQFKVGLTQPEGIPPSITYPSSGEKIDLIIPDVINSAEIFNYYNGNGDILTGTIDSTNVKMIRLTISLDKNGDLPPGPTTETTEVMLRNMKNNL